jgi:hypothetical protein
MYPYDLASALFFAFRPHEFRHEMQETQECARVSGSSHAKVLPIYHLLVGRHSQKRQEDHLVGNLILRTTLRQQRQVFDALADT